MSFFPPSGGGVNSKTVIAHGNDPLNTIELELDGISMLSGSFETDATWNASIDMQIQKQDLSWVSIFSTFATNDKRKILGNTVQNNGGVSSILQNGSEIYPYNIRFIITFQGTLGTCTIKINYL